MVYRRVVLYRRPRKMFVFRCQANLILRGGEGQYLLQVSTPRGGAEATQRFHFILFVLCTDFGFLGLVSIREGRYCFALLASRCIVFPLGYVRIPLVLPGWTCV